MAIDFPASPTVGQEHVSGGMTYVYNGTGWTIKGGSTTDFVKKTGDTMTGDLIINKDNPNIYLNKTGNPGGNINGQRNGVMRWGMNFADSTPETGADIGSDFRLTRFTDDGLITNTALLISRATGQVTIGGVPLTLPAAPLDAMAYNGMQVNGSFDVSQQNGTTGTGTIGGCPADGWLLGGSGSAVVTIKQAASGPIMLGNGFSNFINVGINVASPVLASTESIAMSQRIEGVRISRLGWGFANAKPITISFWVMHVRTGLYSLAIRNFDGSRSYIATYTQNTASTWEYKTLNIPGCVDGVWKVDNTVGIAISFMLGAGSAITASVANSWIAGSFFAAPGQVNAVASLSDGSNFAGVCILPGIYAPTAAQSPLIMRPFDQELVTCQRYWQKTYAIEQAPGTNTGSTGIVGTSTGTLGRPMLQWVYPTRMRASPTVTFYNPVSGLVGGAQNFNTGGNQGLITTFALTNAMCIGYVNNTPALGDLIGTHMVVDARL